MPGSVNVSQAIGTPLYLVNQDWYNAWIAFTKQSFSLLMITLTQFWAPTKVKISGDESVRGQLFQTTEGHLLCNFPQRMVLMANHQIYTDWLYLWWIAYTNGMHGRVYIVLKESLKKIPIIGWGMQMSRFIFLKRNWEQDRPRLAAHLKKLTRGLDPMWLMLFPEGTNLAPSTREKSKEWAEKKGIKDMKHTLLPRGTGLMFCLRELRGSLRWVYDCTIAYEGVPRGQYAQDIYTLPAQFGQGKPPKCVHMHWRRFHISSIPLEDPIAFEVWLRARWIEKDYLIDFFYQHGRFPIDTGVTTTANGVKRRGAGLIETQIQATNWYEYLQTFAPVGVLGLILYAIYGALPKKFVEKMKEMSALRAAELKQMTAGIFDQKFMPRLNEIALANPIIQAIKAGKLPQFNINIPEKQKAALREVLPASIAPELASGNSSVRKATAPKALPAPPKATGARATTAAAKSSASSAPSVTSSVGSGAKKSSPKKLPSSGTPLIKQPSTNVSKAGTATTKTPAKAAPPKLLGKKPAPATAPKKLPKQPTATAKGTPNSTVGAPRKAK